MHCCRRLVAAGVCYVACAGRLCRCLISHSSSHDHTLLTTHANAFGTSTDLCTPVSSSGEFKARSGKDCLNLLQVAIKAGDIETIEELVDKFGANLDARTERLGLSVRQLAGENKKLQALLTNMLQSRARFHGRNEYESPSLAWKPEVERTKADWSNSSSLGASAEGEGEENWGGTGGGVSQDESADIARIAREKALGAEARREAIKMLSDRLRFCQVCPWQTHDGASEAYCIVRRPPARNLSLPTLTPLPRTSSLTRRWRSCGPGRVWSTCPSSLPATK